MLEVLTVVGARPQFVKAAVLSRFVQRSEWRDRVHETLVHTGQHYDENMSEVFFREMEIPKPDVNLSTGSGTHGKMTGQMLEKLEALMLERRPDVVLVYGDTNSTLAGALAASKLHIPVAHVEAGLRSHMMAMPEEQNRKLTDHLSTWLFCPTQTAVENLAREGKPVGNAVSATADLPWVGNVGDIMFEASFHYRPQALARAESLLNSLPSQFFLLTIHRAENTDDPARLAAIVQAINAQTETPAVFPIHPRTRKILAERGLSFAPHVHLLDPVGYFEMLALEQRCEFVVTDSGGVQKEAYFFGKPCLTLRDSTEWVELVDSGWNTLVGADAATIAAGFSNLKTPSEAPNLYGSGDTAYQICQTLLGGR